MPSTMQALHYDPDATPPLRYLSDAPVPQPTTGEVLIRVDLTGICATDLEITRGYMQFRGVLGHEFVGTVVAGETTLVGRRVCADINCSCGTCAWCQRGLGNHCPQRTVMGIAGRGGCFAEYLAVPARNCHVVPPTISDDQAVFVEPLAAAAHVLDIQPLTPQTRAAVIGPGRLGLLVAQVLAQQPCVLTVIGRSSRSKALCAQLGLPFATAADMKAGPRFDFVVECSGNPDGLRLALALCAPRGTLVLKSTYAEPQPVDLAPIVINELRVEGSRCGDFPRALQLLAEGRIQVDPLISARFPLADGVTAFAAAARPENTKILLRPGSTA